MAPAFAHPRGASARRCGAFKPGYCRRPPSSRAGAPAGWHRARSRAVPPLLLGDEPFASVDPALARQLGEAIPPPGAGRGLTVILVLHQLQLARTLADRIVGLARGQVAFDGPAAAFDTAAEDRVFSSTQLNAGWSACPLKKWRPYATQTEPDGSRRRSFGGWRLLAHARCCGAIRVRRSWL